jgi:HD-like signal output (HDOD) protein
MNAASPPELDALIKHFDIPPCPAVINDLQRELRKETANAATIAKLISRDVGMAGAIMRLVNSPAFRTGREIGSIDQALAILGLGRVFDLIVGELLRKSMASGRGIRLDRYWDNAACCADLCATLASRLPGTRVETAYCFGLFHDCGIPLLMRRFASYRQTLQLANTESGLGLLAAEEAVHGTNHALVGYLLARTWGLSAVLCEAIREHHNYAALDPQVSERLPDEVCTLIGISAIAEHVAGLHLRTRQEGQWLSARGPVAAFFGLADADLDDLIEDLLLEQQQASAA